MSESPTPTTPSAKVVRTWGPFSGRQLTTIIVAAIAASALVPSAVYAATTFTGVVVQDATSGAQAKVTSAGALTVSGTVTARPAAPITFVHSSLAISSTCAVLAAPPAGSALVITSVHVNVFQNPTPGFANNVLVYRDAACTVLLDDMNPGGLGMTALDYGNGITIPAGGALAARRQGSVQAEAYAFGYTVAPSAVPFAPAPAAAASGPNVAGS